MTSLQFLAVGLACFRITRLFTNDFIMEPFRKEAVKKAPRGKKWLMNYLVHCPFCASFYVAGAFTFMSLWLGFVTFPEVIFWHPAIWGSSIMWNEIFCALYKRA